MKTMTLVIILLSILQISSIIKINSPINTTKYLKRYKVPKNLQTYLAQREEKDIYYEHLETNIFKTNLFESIVKDRSCVGFKRDVPVVNQRVYFNDLSKPDNLEFYIKRALDRVYCVEKPEILIAAYELSNSNLVEKLIELKKNNSKLTVKVVIEHDVIKKSKVKRSKIDKLKQAGILIKTDGNVKGNNLMHHKFIIINQRWLLTGSTNFSNRGTKVNNNNLVEIYSKDVCKIYTTEFNKLWMKKFSRSKKNQGNIHKVNDEISTIIGPSKNISHSMYKLISSAKVSIDISMFSLTSTSILKLLTILGNSNIMIRVKLDNLTLGGKIRFSGRREKLKNYLNKIKISYESDGTNTMYHHKYLVIDANTENAKVMVGSMNYSDSGFFKNDENILILSNSAIVNKFHEHFDHNYTTKVKEPNSPKKIRWPSFKSIIKNGNELKVSVFDNNDFNIKVKDNKRWIKSYTDYGLKKEFVIKGYRKKRVLKLYSESGIFFEELLLNTDTSILQVPNRDCVHNFLKSNMWYEC